MGERYNAYSILTENPEGKRHYEDLEAGGRILLNWMLEK
jgi:hypothetical protein